MGHPRLIFIMESFHWAYGYFLQQEQLLKTQVKDGMSREGNKVNEND